MEFSINANRDGTPWVIAVPKYFLPVIHFLHLLPFWYVANYYTISPGSFLNYITKYANYITIIEADGSLEMELDEKGNSF